MDDVNNKKIKITKTSIGTEVSDLKIFKRNYSSSFQQGTQKEEKEKPKKKSVAITPINENKHHTCVINTFAALDIETVDNPKGSGNQTAIAISLVYEDPGNNKLIKKLFIDKDERELFIEFFKYINSEEFINHNIRVIFAHNLGNFDGLFLFRGLLKVVGNIKEITTLIDQHNKFILIKYKNIVFKDSFRIFPVSLEDLCKNFGVDGKLSKYDENFNSLEIFNNQKLFYKFQQYSLNDSICLFNALMVAPAYAEHYIHHYQVDITTIFSTSTLSLRIFRQHHLKEPIPILKEWEDQFIRASYYGGATDYYIKYAENLYYSDVNSLYPYAMLNDMPVNIKSKNFVFGPDFDLNKFFGFLQVEVTAPKDLIIPMLPFKYKGKTIFPTGRWYGTYFSEELKAVAAYGYTFRYISGIEYHKTEKLFDSYIQHFYQIKKESKGSQRFVAKMHLNQLYGYFGRSLECLETYNIKNSELQSYLSQYIVKNIMEVDDDTSVILVSKGINFDIQSHFILDETFSNVGMIPLYSNTSPVLSNVAIASAVTSYARIRMMPVKDLNCCYTDTDSVITTVPLDSYLMGKELGLFKDELDGKKISKGVFLGIKQYGYIIDGSEKSVFAGVPRDSIKYAELEAIGRGEVLNKKVNNKFFKSMKDLKMKIMSSSLNIKANNNKILINNRYFPINVDIPYKSHDNSRLMSIFKILIRNINNAIKKILG